MSTDFNQPNELPQSVETPKSARGVLSLLTKVKNFVSAVLGLTVTVVLLGYIVLKIFGVSGAGFPSTNVGDISEGEGHPVRPPIRASDQP